MEIIKQLKYTKDSRINKRVEEIIEELKERLVSRFNPRSIIIVGGFGRGEVTLIEENGKLRFLSDCEIILLPYKWIFSRGKLNEFENKFYKDTGLKVEISGFTPTISLYFPIIKVKPTIATYDLKYGSKIIYGKDYLKRIPCFKPDDIPLSEGIILLLNRMAEALEYFPPGKHAEETVFWTDKIVLACRDALLLTIGRYHPSHMERNKMFIESMKLFNISCTQIIANFVIEATNRKQNRITVPFDLKEYWFQVNRISDEVLRYVVKTYNIRFNDYSEFQRKYLSSCLRNYTTLPFNSTVLQNFFRFFKRMATRYQFPTFRMLLKLFVRWDHIIYSCIPLVYFGLNEKYEVNAKYMERVLKTLKMLGYKDERVANSFEDWNTIKHLIITYWRQLTL